MPEKLKIIITGDASNAKSAIDSVGNSVGGLETKLVKYSAAAAAAGVAFIATQSIKAASKFEAAISDLSAITGATGKDLDFLAEKSKEFGKTTTLSASEAAEAFKLVASAKPDLLDNAAALSAVTKEAIVLAEASGSTLPDAARTLGSALNQFNADASESGRFINVLAAGAKFGASEIAETALALKESGTVAAGAGISFETLNAAIQSLSTVSIKGGQAGTQLRNIILKLQAQAKDEFNPAIVGLEKSLQNLNAANLDTAELTKLFGLESVTAAKALINQSDNLGELTGKLTATNTAYEQASTKTDNLQGDMKALDSALEGVLITMGQEFGPELRSLAQDTIKFIRAMEPVAVATAQAIIIAFKPVTTIFSAITAGIEAFQAGAEASNSKVRGVMQSVESFNKVLLPNRELLKEMGINVRDIDPRNIDEVTAAMSALNKHSRENNVELETRGRLNNHIIAQERQKAEATKKTEEKVAEPAKEKEDEDKGPTKEEMAAQRAIEATQRKNDKLREMAEEFQLSEEEREVARYERENEQFNRDLELLVERGILVDEAIALQRQGREDAEAIHAEKLRQIQENAQTSEQKLWESGWQGKVQLATTGMAQIASGLGKDSKAIFAVNKGLALAQTAISLPSSVMQSFERAGGYPWGIPPAAAMAAKGAAEIAKIKGAKFQQAHGGLDRNVGERTMLIRNDEMVLDPGTSREVRNAAVDIANGRSGGSSGGVNIGTININAKVDLRNMTSEQWDEIVETGLAPAIRRGADKLLDFGLQPSDEAA